MPTWLEQLEAHWQQPDAPGRASDWLLRPLAGLYGAVSARQRAQYLSGKRPRTRLPVPTIVVGNVVAGGAGKTPVVIALTQALQLRGLQVGIVSRGYGRSSKACLEVSTDSTASMVGDEPLMVQQATHAPVFVASSRAEAGLALLKAYPETDCIVCDDGLQHWPLQHDYELCVFPPWGIGNGRLIPAGPLRERWPRAVDAVIQSVNAAETPANIPTAVPPAPYWPLTRQLAGVLRNGLGQSTPLAALQQQPDPIVAVAGIAKPQAFFSMLQARGMLLQQCIALPDHYAFSSLPPELSALSPATQLICTEKDAVKLWRLMPHAWAIGLQVDWQDNWTDHIMERAFARYQAQITQAGHGG